MNLRRNEIAIYFAESLSMYGNPFRCALRARLTWIGFIQRGFAAPYIMEAHPVNRTINRKKLRPWTEIVQNRSDKSR